MQSKSERNKERERERRRKKAPPHEINGDSEGLRMAKKKVAAVSKIPATSERELRRAAAV